MFALKRCKANAHNAQLSVQDELKREGFEPQYTRGGSEEAGVLAALDLAREQRPVMMKLDMGLRPSTMIDDAKSAQDLLVQ